MVAAKESASLMLSIPQDDAAKRMLELAVPGVGFRVQPPPSKARP